MCIRDSHYTEQHKKAFYEAVELAARVQDLSLIHILLIINYPNNPTGRILHEDEADILEAFLLAHPQVYLLSDEVYERIVYGRHSISMAARPSVRERVITMNGFSKSVAMTGWRMGYLAAPKPVYDVAYLSLIHIYQDN